MSGTRSACASNSEGTISDVRWNGPADKARLAPGYKIIAVNGNVFQTTL
jgi:predicted metalloprotease with PDZ domain